MTQKADASRHHSRRKRVSNPLPVEAGVAVFDSRTPHKFAGSGTKLPLGKSDLSNITKERRTTNTSKHQLQHLDKRTEWRRHQEADEEETK